MLSTTFEGIEYRFYDHLYAVSACGKVLRKLEPVEPRTRPDGYLEVGHSSRRLMHRMVATCWCERPAGARVVHHRNETKSDNRAENLEWLVSQATHVQEHHPGASRGHKMTEEGKARLRALRLGSKASEETKQKQREANLRLGIRPPPPVKGYRATATAIQRMRENSPNAVACEIDGVHYASFSAAGEALGAKPHTLRKRCLSKNFPSYRLAEGSI